MPDDLLQCSNSHCALHQTSEKGFDMTEQFRTGEQFQRASQQGFDAVVRAYGEANKGLQAIAAEVTDYSKNALEDATRAFQQLVTAKSAEQAFEIQSQYAKKAYEATLPKPRNSARCGLVSRATPTSQSSEPLPRRSRKRSHRGWQAPYKYSAGASHSSLCTNAKLGSHSHPADNPM